MNEIMFDTAAFSYDGSGTEGRSGSLRLAEVSELFDKITGHLTHSEIRSLLVSAYQLGWRQALAEASMEMMTTFPIDPPLMPSSDVDEYMNRNYEAEAS